jgi:FAD/FMN-containing dehydrogenase
MANNMTASIPQSNIESYRATMRGEVLEPSNPSYDESRVVWNGMIDRRPALIARCRNAADVAASVNFARDHGLPIAIRSGGHNVAGYAVCNDGLMIDMSLMNAA